MESEKVHSNCVSACMCVRVCAHNVRVCTQWFVLSSVARVMEGTMDQ